MGTKRNSPWIIRLAAGLIAGGLAGTCFASPTTESPEVIRQRIVEALEPPAPESTSSPGQIPVPSPTATPEPYGVLVARIQRETEALWGGEVGHTVTPRLLNRTEIGELIDRLLEEELQRPSNIAQLETFAFLGLIPEDKGPRELYGKLLEGQVGGLYNPKDKSLYVVDTFNPRGFLGGVILSHEITHAIQDAAWDLETYVQSVDDMDLRRARLAAIEGDATVTMIEWGRDNFTPAVLLELTTLLGQQAADLNAMPPALVQDLLFPYLAGSTFCLALQAAKGPAWRQHLGANPPASTEQILHPAKYLANPPDLPKPIEPPSVPDGASEVLRNSMGEWGIRLLLTPPERFPRISMLMVDPMLNDATTTKAAAGWEADEFVFVRRDDAAEGEAAKLFLWHTLWETETDALEFEEAFTSRAAGLGLERRDSTGPAEQGTWEITREGKMVRVSIGR
jgi:hypothetical protein